LRLVRSPLYELVEAANPSIVSPILVEELEIALVEDAKEFIPRHALQALIIVSAGLVEIDAQNACPLDNGRMTSASFDPAADGIVISRCPGLLV
jgi:hypothetical protein